MNKHLSRGILSQFVDGIDFFLPVWESCQNCVGLSQVFLSLLAAIEDRAVS